MVRPSTRMNKPVEGFYKRTLVKRGPYVAVRFEDISPRDENGERDGDELWRVTTDGVEEDLDVIEAFDQWCWCARRPITDVEYHFMVERARWCREHDPSDPHARPTQPIDISKLRPGGGL